jgi:hypothetical protein
VTPLALLTVHVVRRLDGRIIPRRHKLNAAPLFLHNVLPLSLAWCLPSHPSRRTLTQLGVRVLSRVILANDTQTRSEAPRPKGVASQFVSSDMPDRLDHADEAWRTCNLCGFTIAALGRATFYAPLQRWGRAPCGCGAGFRRDSVEPATVAAISGTRPQACMGNICAVYSRYFASPLAELAGRVAGTICLSCKQDD